MKKMLLIMGMVIGTIALVIGLGYLFIISGAFSIFMSNPPKPEITYGEFPFRLTYELNGEEKVIVDTLICEFDGFKSLGTAGKYRVWKSRLKSGNEFVTLLNLRENDVADSYGNQILELYYYYGNAEYYMNDPNKQLARSGEISNSVDYMYQTADGRIGFSALSSDEAWEKFKIRLIRWEPSEPIPNRFQ